MNSSENLHIGFLIFPGFPMACLTSVIEPLRAANEIAEVAAFRWSLVSEQGVKIESSAGVMFEPDMAFDDVDGVDYLFLLSSPLGQFDMPSRGNGRLRRLDRSGVVLGGISGGVFPLARAGVLQGHRCSVHWCYEAAFRAEFPEIEAEDDVIVLDRRRYTASGAAAGFDLALQLIETRLGAGVATEVACWFQHASIRGTGVRQQLPVVTETEADLPPLVSRAIAILADGMAEPVSIADLAEALEITPRQVERIFKKATGQSPSHYYRQMRMKAARQLVRYSRDSMAEIAAAVGYATTSPMASHYQAEFGISPQEERRQINGFRVQGNGPLPSLQTTSRTPL